jgi:hypothetical protein
MPKGSLLPDPSTSNSIIYRTCQKPKTKAKQEWMSV